MQEARTIREPGESSPRPDVYDRVRQAQLSRGATPEWADAAAARTAVKYGLNGASGAGRATSRPLEEQTRDALYARARELDIPGRSAMTKSELQRALRRAGRA